MNTTLLIVYIIVLLLVGLWVIWDLVKKHKKRRDRLYALGQAFRELAKVNTLKELKDWEHCWRNYY